MWKTQPKQATHKIKTWNKPLFDIISVCHGRSFSEKCWVWINTVVRPGNIPRCYCENLNRYLDFRRGYTTYCGVKCQANAPEIQGSKKSTTLLKYGADHYSKTSDYREKFKQTMLSKYGVENPGQIEELKGKRARNKQLTFFNSVLNAVSNDYTPMFEFCDYTHLRDKNLEWKCNRCENVFKSNLLNKLPLCVNCYPKQYFCGKSVLEKEILGEIKKFYAGEILENVRSIISPKELDIYFPEKKFAIEINGIYWHSEEKVGSNYHQQKWISCNQHGVNLMMITDYEWREKRGLILEMIKHRLGIHNNRIGARKCTVEVISSATAKDFLNNHHMGGFSRGSNHLGLYYMGELCAVCTISARNRFHRNGNEIEIVRLAYSNANVVGAFGKLLKVIQNMYPGRNICSYVDLRYGSGLVYEKTGFKLAHITKPGYWYHIDGKLEHRLNWTKKKLVKNGHCPTMSEAEIMLTLGAVKIYDCGHKYMVLER